MHDKQGNKANTSETDKRGWYWVDTEKLLLRFGMQSFFRFIQHGAFVRVIELKENGDARCRLTAYANLDIPFDCLVPVKGE